MNNDNKDQIDEGTGKYISIGLIASLMAIPSLFGANTVHQKLKRLPKNKIYMRSNEVQNTIKSLDKSQKTYGGYSLSNNINILARTLFREGNDQGEDGRKAIASVIYNRANKDRNKIASVIKRPKAFSCWNGMTSSDWSNFVYKIPKETVNNKTQEKIWFDCVKIAEDVFSGKFKSTIGDRNSYYNPDKANPNWGKQLKNVKTIKNHKFGYLASEDPTKIKTSKSA